MRPLDPQAGAQVLKLPKALAKLTPRGLLNGTARAIGGIAGALTRLSLESTPTFDERIDAVWRTAKHDYPVLVKRDFAAIHWRYDDGPFAPLYARYYVKHRGQIVGYAVARLATWRGHLIARVIDYLVPRRFAGALFALLIETLNAKRAVAVFFEQWHPGSAPLLRALGCIRARPSHRFMFKLRDPGSPLAAALRGADRWFVMPGDSDFDHVLADNDTAGEQVLRVDALGAM